MILMSSITWILPDELGSSAIEYGHSVQVDASSASDVVEYKTLNPCHP